MRKGNKQNALLNGEWGKHVKKFYKRFTAHRRRLQGKELIRRSLNLDPIRTES